MKRKLTLLAITLVLLGLLMEFGLRIFARDLSFSHDERCLMYRHDATLGWFPIPNASNQFTATRTITVMNNNDGFRAPPFQHDMRPRILFIGDSFVWGYDVEARERFTELLQAKHPEWQVLNCGVSGYGTDQEFLLLQRIFDRYKPSAVVLIFCSDTDHDDNSSNVKPGNYFKPYYDGAFRGIPVPKSERAFISEHPLIGSAYTTRLLASAFYHVRNRNKKDLPDSTAILILEMQKFLNEKGAKFAVGIAGFSPPMLWFVKTVGIPCIDLTFESDNSGVRYPTFGEHWTPEGHRIVSERIDTELPDVLAGKRPPIETPSDRALLVLYAGLVRTFDKYGRPELSAAAYRQLIRLDPNLAKYEALKPR